MSKNTLRALLLEDEALIAIGIEDEMEASGLKVASVASCGEAHLWLDREAPDIVIVDIMLRDGPATDVVLRLIESHIPFVVHSGEQQSTHRDSPYDVGTWVSKPSSTNEVSAAALAALMVA